MKCPLAQRLYLIVISALIAACTSTGIDIGPIIGDLEKNVKFQTLGKVGDFYVEVEPEVQFKVSRNQVISSFRELAKVTAEGGGTGDELRRLADLELEASMDNRLSDDEITRLQGEREAIHAILVYEQYLEKYPEREDNDLILYQLSRAYAVESQFDKSLEALDQIARDHPESKYIDEVQFRRGENLFVAREYEAAEEAYGTVVDNHPDSLFFEKALYKYGWTQFKQSRYEDALSSYVRLLDLNLEQKKVEEINFDPELPRGDAELLEDVVRVVSLSFSYQDEKYYISQYFNQNGKRDYEPLLYLKLGQLYIDKSRVVDGSDLFLAYTREYPYSEYTPYFHQRAIEIFQTAGYSDLVLKEKIAFVDRYDVNGEFWSLQSEESLNKLTPTLVLHLSELATHYHAQARASKKKQDYDVAASWYRRFLKSFPEDPTAPRMNFLLAESLYDADRYPQAIDEYEKTAYAYEPHADSAESGYAALIAYDALFKTTNAGEVLALRQKRIKSAVRFTTNHPDDPRLSAVELQTAQQFYEWKDYPGAMASAKRLINNAKVNKKTKQEAWAILADSQFSTGDYVFAEQSYLYLLEFSETGAKQRKAVREQIASSIYKQGEIARDNNDHLAAAGHFVRLGQVVPESPKRIVADYDAATAYLQLEDWPAAIKQLETFRKRYPNDKQFKTGVTEKLALAYSSNGNQSQAAGEMLTLAALPGDNERKRDLMWKAAELYEESGKPERAISVYKNYVKLYPYPLARSIELRHKIAESYRAKNDNRNLRIWLNEIVLADARAKSERSDRSRYLAATASLELVQPLQQKYHTTRLTVPLKASLKKKKKLMQQSIDAYSKAMNYQVAEVTTEATYQIAEIYHDFAKSLMDSQRPKGLSEDQLEEYDLLLEEQAYPFEEKAIDIHLANFKRIPQGSYDEPVKRSLEVLGELMPFRFARMESSDVYVEIQ
ncbi:MAG: tetratricopeptide repeat protein [Pseudomonadota bacterium]